MFTKSEFCPKVLSFDSGQKGPVVTILGGVHGSEKPGIAVVQKMMSQDLSDIISRGRLNVGIGNPNAVLAGERFVSGDFDLNRSFGEIPEGFLDTIAVQRANVLKTILTQTDILLDIHSTLKPSKSMIISPNADRLDDIKTIAQLFGIDIIVIEPMTTKGMATDAYVASQGGLGITVETGHQDDTNVIPRIEGAILKYLKHLGITDCEVPDAKEDINDIQQFYAYRSILVPEDGLSFEGQWANFETLSKGTHFATTGDGEKLIANEDSFILFQKDPERIIPGVQACQLLRMTNKNEKT